MGLFSWLGSAVNAVVGGVTKAVKTVAAKAIDFMANKAESFVGEVKQAWRKVKPYVLMAQAPLQKLAAATATIPIIGTVVNVFSSGVNSLLALENSEVLNKIEKAITFAANKARDLEKQIKNGEIAWLSPEEYEEAIKNRKSFRSAEKEADSLTPAQKHTLDMATAINDFGIAKTDLQNAIKAGWGNYEHYLRLRATEKLLTNVEAAVIQAGSIDGLTEDDWFLVRTASDLVKDDPEMKEAAAVRLDTILRNKYGKPLQSFVYEELIVDWKANALELSKRLREKTEELAKSRVSLKNLQTAKEIQGELDAKESAELAHLEKIVPALETELAALAIQRDDMDRYSDAAEGFLQLVEKSEAQLEDEDRGYVLDEALTVRDILLKVGESKLPYSSLEPDQRELIRDFANIFHFDAVNRTKALVEVAA